MGAAGVQTDVGCDAGVCNRHGCMVMFHEEGGQVSIAYP